jgi:hypothetical protein
MGVKLGAHRFGRMAGHRSCFRWQLDSTFQ